MLFRPKSPDANPVAEITRWRVFEVRKSETSDVVSRHFVGRVDGFGRVSSPIQSYDTTERAGVTASGRKYVLKGDKGTVDLDAGYVWNAWKQINGVLDWADVTEEYETKEGEK